MDKKTFDNFFKPYSQNVDKVDSTSAFWRLSDALILEIIKENIGKYCTKESVICDAGGGTGRWVVKMSQEFPGDFIIYDRSGDMLKKAKENIQKADLSTRVSLIEGDITNMEIIENESIDHVVSIYSPISFIYEYEKAFSELHRILKVGGKILIMAHSYYNALFSKINNYQAGREEILELAKHHRVKWAPHVPELITFSKETMESILSKTGFQIERTYGVPVLVQPGQEDFDPENEKVSTVSKYLENPGIFREVFSLEMEHNSKDTVSNRGMNIFALATKI